MAGRTVTNYARRYVRDRAEAHMNCSVTITRHNAGVLDQDTGLYTADTGKVIYRGIARIWDSSTGAIINVGDADLATTVVYCSIPYDSAVPRVDDTLTVTESPGDPALVDRAFRILFIDGGGLARATRKMQISAIAQNRSWSPEDY